MYLIVFYLEVIIMAKTKKGNKIVCVGGYTKSNGTKVKGHRRSTPRK